MNRTRPGGAATPPWSPLWDGIALLAVLAGIGLRLRLLLANRAFWLDEAMLALNLVERSWRDLLRPLGWDQAAPPLFLWISKAAGHLGGGREVLLRAFPFLAGVATLLLVWGFGRRLLTPAAAAVATLLVAVSPTLIYYSTELKPYMSDAMIAVALLGAAVVVRLPPRPGAGWWGLALGGMMALVASFTAPYLLAGTGSILAVRAWGRPDRARALAVVAATGLAWLAVFALLYLTLYRTSATNPFLQEFWAPVQLRNLAPVSLAVWHTAAVLLVPLPIPTEGVRMAVLLPVVLLLAAAAGRRFGWGWLAVPAVMLALVLATSWLRLYPLEPRLMLFLAPVTLGILGAGLAVVLEGLVRPAGLRAGAALALAGVLAGWGAGWQGRGPGTTLDDRNAVLLVSQRPPGTPVYLLQAATSKYPYYTTDWRAPDTARLRWFSGIMSHGGPGFRATRSAAGLGTPGAGLLANPGNPLELVAHASGTGGGPPGPDTPAWADAEASRLVSLGATEVWVYAGAHHERDLPFLLAALGARGAGWEELHRTPKEVVGVVRAPRRGPRGP